MRGSGVIGLGVNQAVWKTEEEEDHCFEGVHGVAILLLAQAREKLWGNGYKKSNKKMSEIEMPLQITLFGWTVQ